MGLVGGIRHSADDDACLQADLMPLAAKVPGYVRRVPVQNFRRVKAGDLLVEIVDDDYRSQLHQAEANMAAAQAAIDNIEQQRTVQENIIKQAEATIEASKADVTRYHLEAGRQQNLFAEGLASTNRIPSKQWTTRSARRPPSR